MKRLRTFIFAAIIAFLFWASPVVTQPETKDLPIKEAAACYGPSSVSLLGVPDAGAGWTCFDNPNCWEWKCAEVIRGGCLRYEQKCTCTHNPDPPAPVYSAPSSSISITCDVSGGGGWCVSGAKAVITASDPQGFAVSITGAATTSLDSVSFNCSSYPCKVALPSGAGTVSYSGTASTSGLTTSGNSVFSFDNVKPVISGAASGTNGLNGWWTDASFSANASDSISGLQAFVLTNNGAVSTSPIVLPEGVNNLVGTANDVAGNVQSQNWTVNVDGTPPVITHNVSGTPGSAGWYIHAVYTASATDPVSGVSSLVVTDNGVVRTLPFELADGSHTIIATATDNAGNVSSVTESVKVDSTKPGISILSPSVDTILDGEITLTGDSSDAMSGLDAVEISIDGGATWQPLANGKWTFTFDSTGMPNGKLNMTARAFDKAGNESFSSSSILLANQKPKASLPETWLYTEAGALAVETYYFSIGSTHIEITDEKGNALLSQQMTDVPAAIAWDGKFLGELLPAGEYPVVVTVCDTNRKCASAAARIVIPVFNYVFPEPEPEPKVVVVPQAPPVVEEIPEPVRQLAANVRGAVSVKSLGLLMSAGALFAFLFSQSALDPRPKAMRSLANTIRKTMNTKE